MEVKAIQVGEAKKAKEDVEHNTAFNKIHKEVILPAFEGAVTDFAESVDKAQGHIYTGPTEISKILGIESEGVTAVLTFITSKTKQKVHVYAKKANSPNWELSFKSDSYRSMKPTIFNVNSTDGDEISNEILGVYFSI